MSKILYPDGILTKTERNIMYFLAALIISSGLIIWFFLFEYILSYVLVVFSIIFTLLLIYFLMKYKNNDSSLPSYEALNTNSD